MKDVSALPHYVYRCYSADGRLVYVGCTHNLPGRLKQHAASTFWVPLVVKVKAKVYPNKWAGREAERQAIREEAPRFNLKGRPGSQMLWTDSEWDDYILALEHVPQPERAAKLAARAREHREATRRVKALMVERGWAS